MHRAVEEYATRHADAIAEGIERARRVLAGGDAAIVAPSRHARGGCLAA